MYRLVCEDRLDVANMDAVSLDDVDLSNRALDAWQGAQRRAQEKAAQRSKKGRR